MAMALQLPITILAIVLNVLDSSVSEVCSSEAPFAIPGVQGNLEFKASSFKVNQPRSSAFAFINSLSRQRHGRMLGPVLNDSTSPRISLILIIMANDCSTMNPGPVKDPCGICQKPTRSNQRAIQCDECDMWYHTKCIAMTAQSYDRLGSDSQLAWLCNKCLFPNFSTTFLLNEMDLCHENRFESLSSDSTISSDPGSPLFTSSPSRFHDPQGNRVKITRRKLKILSLNCNGLKSPAKKSQFQSLVALHDPDVILGCESKINAIIPTYSIFPENYEVYRRDRTASGGGVFIAVRNDLTAVEERGLDVDGAEMITASIHLAKRKKLFLTSFYRPPTDQEGLGLLDDYLCKLFTKYQQCPNAIIGGDFNCSGIDWSSGEAVLTPPVHSWDLALIALAEKYGLSQHVKSPTRYDSFLDLAFSSKPGLVSACHVTSGLSDHSAVLFEVDLAPKYIPKPPRKIYLYHKADMVALKEHIASFYRVYAATHMERSVEENWNAISTCISDAMERFIPSKTSKTKRHLPWIGAPIKKLMRKRDRAFKKSKRTGKEKDHVNYKRLRNIVSNSIKESHNNYVSEIMKGIDLESDEPRPKGVKRAWSYLKLLRSESLGIPTLFWEGRVCANDKCKAEALRAQYDSVFTQEDNLNVPTLAASPHQDIKDISFSVNGVRVQLDNIRVDKACGPDAVPARVLKEAATELAPILTLLFEQSMKDGVLPTVWKDANISAIYKKGLRSDPQNYRPVSLTSLVSKLMEHIVSKHIMCHLSVNNIITQLQHGFLKGLSCSTQLISVIHDWSSVLNDHGQVDVVFLDFAKAFDSVPHERLLIKAEFYGIRGRLLLWLRHFLTNRRQRVVVNGASSTWSPVLSGVPQGTVLGPILFLLFINDLPSGIKSHVKLFADDSVLYRPIKSLDDHHALQQDLHYLERWAEQWQMKFAPKKCYVMTITLKRDKSQFPYHLCGTTLEGVSVQKYLGVHISTSLNWSKHTEEVKKKANAVLGILQRNLSSCPAAVKEQAYKALVRPLVEYGTEAWSPHTKKDIQKVESVQRRAARFVCNDYGRHSSVTNMLTHLGWHQLELRRTVFDSVMFYKIYHGLVKIDFPSDVIRKPGSYTTRSSVRNTCQLTLPPPSINQFKYSFFSRTIPVWNSLPQQMLDLSSVDEFKIAVTGELARQ